MVLSTQSPGLSPQSFERHAVSWEEALQTRDEHAEIQSIDGVDLEVLRGGAGPSVVLLHGCFGWWGWEAVHERLAERFTVIAPSHPGFGRSPRVPGVDTVDDLAYYYLDYLTAQGLAPARIIGFGLGGWLAAEIAVRCPNAVDRLVLVDTLGIKISDPTTRDVGDPFILLGNAQQAMLWFDPSTHHAPVPVAGMAEPFQEAMVRNLESAMYYGWKPYMHNPKLRQRLHRITAPTLVVWGRQDQVVSTRYGQAFAEGIPAARFIAIDDAGHFPHREQVDTFIPPVVEFLGADP